VFGTVIEVTCLLGYSRDDSCDWYFDEPILVFVNPTEDSDIVRDCDEYIDPYWDVTLVNDVLKPGFKRELGLPADCGSFYVDGSSYKFTKEETTAVVLST
jgi:hypothetical protein